MKFIKTMMALLLVVPLFSQTGKIAGTLTDSDSGETLISAYIYVENTDVVEASDFDGKYSVELAAGIYTLKYTYIGFADKLVKEIEVKDGEVTYLDVAMSAGSQQLDEVVVTAKIIDKTENSVLLLRKKSDKIQDGISSQEMRKFAVGNVAAAVTKVTAVSVEDGKYLNIRGLGDRYSIAQLNGLTLPSIDPYKNSADLDLIPTNLLDNIITSKTFSPDQPGNFAGGSLNIKTKSFPEERTLSISLSTTYNSQNHLIDNFLTNEGSDLDWLGYGAGDRARPSFFDDEDIQNAMTKNAELQARLAGDEQVALNIQKVVDAVDLSFDPIKSNTLLDRGIAISYGESWDIGSKGSLGVVAAASYKNTYDHLEDKITKRWFATQSDSEALENIGDYVIQESTMTPVVNGLAGLAYKFNPLNSIDYKLVYNHNTTKKTSTLFGEKPENIIDPLYLETTAQEYTEREMINQQVSGNHVIPSLNNMKINWAGGYIDAKVLSPSLTTFSNQFNVETGGRGIPLSNVDDPTIFWRDLQDNIINGKIDIELPLNIGLSSPSKIKVGAYYDEKNRDSNENFIQLFTPGNNIAQRFDGDYDAFVSEDNVGYLGPNEAGTRYNIGNYLIDASNPNNSYVGNSTIIAGYAMGTFQITEKFKAVTGARYEYTDISTTGKNENKPLEERSAQIKVGDLLPSVNLIYGITDNMNLRGSYNRTVARPNLQEIAPFVIQDILLNEFVLGNIDLERTNITNADLRWEYFLQPGEIISAGGFYKYFDNPIVLQYGISSNPERQFVNVESGFIFGLELEFRKNLDFISPALRNLKFSSNFSSIISETLVNDLTGLEIASRPFSGQADFIVNAGLLYSEINTGLDVGLSYNYTGDKLYGIGQEATPDVYDQARHQLDFILSKNVGNATISINAKNLLNSSYTRFGLYPGPDGVGEEYIWESYKRGVDFGLSLGYKF